MRCPRQISFLLGIPPLDLQLRINGLMRGRVTPSTKGFECTSNTQFLTVRMTDKSLYINSLHMKAIRRQILGLSQISSALHLSADTVAHRQVYKLELNAREQMIRNDDSWRLGPGSRLLLSLGSETTGSVHLGVLKLSDGSPSTPAATGI